MRDAWIRVGPALPRTAVYIVAAVLAGACGTEPGSTDIDAGGSHALAGLSSCDGSSAPIAAFWGSADGVGFPSDDEDAPVGGDIWSISAGGDVKAITEDGRSRDPSLSDDGTRLYFTRGDGGLRAGSAARGTELWVTDLPSGDSTRVFDAGLGSTGVQDIEESPDGRFVAFSAQVGDSRPRVYIVDLASHDDVSVLPLPPVDDKFPYQWQASPTWSPDSLRLAYVLVENDSMTGWRASLHIVDRGTGADVTVYQPLDDTDIVSAEWAADGRSFLVTETDGASAPNGNGLKVGSVDVETGQLSTVVDLVPGVVTSSSADGRTVSSIGWTLDQLGLPPPQRPVVMTWSSGDLDVEDLPVELSFASELTIAACAYATRG